MPHILPIRDVFTGFRLDGGIIMPFRESSSFPIDHPILRERDPRKRAICLIEILNPARA
jgi:hypothetical protein